ncbi:MAG: hypothetical protein WCD89_13650 [Anaerocolumna sp.]
MTVDIDGNYRKAYTYINGERTSVKDLEKVEGVLIYITKEQDKNFII